MWPLARVIETYLQKDENTRVVLVKTKSGKLICPIKRLFPHEISNMESDNTDVTETFKRNNLL